ncbi:MAG: hypothetical protein JNL12_02905 [Planctomycetes bacterium]|nr:hypothetical protein [Planctomycetota bacterium]
MAHAPGAQSKPSGRRVFTLAVLLFVAVVVGLWGSASLDQVARLGVPTMQPTFVDAYAISGASVSLAQGADPLVHNPGDVRQRPMNYPRPWLLLAHAGLAPEHTPWLVGAFLSVFGLGLWALRTLVTSRPAGALLAIGLFSPVVWLAVERGNNELLVFGLVAWSAGAVARRPGLASCGVFAATLAKLFPVFALVGLLLGGPRARRSAWLALAAIGGWLVITFADLGRIRAGTFHWNRIGYGIDQAATTLAKNGLSLPLLLATAIGAAVVVLLVGGWLRTRVRLSSPGERTEPASVGVVPFAMGAAIYVGSFCTGSSFDYRLLFLLLTVPQLVVWSGSLRGRWRFVARAALGLVLAMLWSLTWQMGLKSAFGPRGEALGLLLDEALSWLLFAGLSGALWLLVPDAFVPQRWRGRPLLDGRGDVLPLPVPVGVGVEPARPARSSEVG